MGKTSKWFKALFGFKKTDTTSSSSSLQKKWSNVKSYRNNDFQQHHPDRSRHYGVSTSIHVDPTNSPVTVEEVLEPTASSGGIAALTTRNGVVFGREEWAAVVIQSHFRACLGPTTPDKFEHVIRARSMKNDEMFMLKRNSSNHMGCSMDFGKPYITSTHRYLFHSSDLSLNSDNLSYSLDETCFSSADTSPQLHSASSKCARSRRGPFTPTKSTDGTRSYSSDYSGNHQNYMSYTEAAKAKTRSMSAPKLRPQYDKRYSKTNLQKGSNFDTTFTRKGVYSGSGQLDRHGMPVRGDSDEFSRGFLHIY